MMAIIVIVTGIALGSLSTSQSLQVFNNNFDKIVSIISNARSMAITGKGQLDYTDADNDICNNNGAILPDGTCIAPDYVTPANYGIRLDSTAGMPNVILFADANPPTTGTITGAIGRFDDENNWAAGDDPVLGESLSLPPELTMEIVDGGSVPPGGTAYASGSIFFSPNYADISFESFTASPFLDIKLTDARFSRCRRLRIHRLAGVPEIQPCS